MRQANKVATAQGVLNSVVELSAPEATVANAGVRRMKQLVVDAGCVSFDQYVRNTGECLFDTVTFLLFVSCLVATSPEPPSPSMHVEVEVWVC